MCWIIKRLSVEKKARGREEWPHVIFDKRPLNIHLIDSIPGELRIRKYKNDGLKLFEKLHSWVSAPGGLNQPTSLLVRLCTCICCKSFLFVKVCLQLENMKFVTWSYFSKCAKYTIGFSPICNLSYVHHWGFVSFLIFSVFCSYFRCTIADSLFSNLSYVHHWRFFVSWSMCSFWLFWLRYVYSPFFLAFRAVPLRQDVSNERGVWSSSDRLQYVSGSNQKRW